MSASGKTPPRLQLMGTKVRFLMIGSINFDHPLEIRHANSKTQIITKCVFDFDPGRQEAFKESKII